MHIVIINNHPEDMVGCPLLAAETQSLRPAAQSEHDKLPKDVMTVRRDLTKSHSKHGLAQHASVHYQHRRVEACVSAHVARVLGGRLTSVFRSLIGIQAFMARLVRGFRFSVAEGKRIKICRSSLLVPTVVGEGRRGAQLQLKECGVGSGER